MHRGPHDMNCNGEVLTPAARRTRAGCTGVGSTAPNDECTAWAKRRLSVTGGIRIGAAASSGGTCWSMRRTRSRTRFTEGGSCGHDGCSRGRPEAPDDVQDEALVGEAAQLRRWAWKNNSAGVTR